ncbi:hypothetical protein SC1083_1176 [Aggregatibacter actinomycetemcomitans serotype e str. SC1083]|uniref:Uncharacterized protein n=1 Tax=Aggregatibacter actinomycetemcomitans serotype e str. SC1083 TaxID=907488 RepID=G4A8M4_AGGAC|nr:hypothetical protein SC1083_1176 [Aggregatibacter actinomycetemcomitans serotype e str. SC1083]
MFFLIEFAPNSLKMHKTTCGMTRYPLISAPLFFIKIC